MFGGPTKTQKRYDPTGTSKTQDVPQNEILKNNHGIVMRNPNEVTEASRSMLLNLLTQLSKFIKLAEAVMDNLKGKNSPDEQNGSLRKLSDTTRENPATTPPLKKEPSTFNSFERSQARLHTIPVVEVAVPRK